MPKMDKVEQFGVILAAPLRLLTEQNNHPLQKRENARRFDIKAGVSSSFLFLGQETKTLLGPLGPLRGEIGEVGLSILVFADAF